MSDKENVYVVGGLDSPRLRALLPWQHEEAPCADCGVTLLFDARNRDKIEAMGAIRLCAACCVTRMQDDPPTGPIRGLVGGKDMSLAECVATINATRERN